MPLYKYVVTDTNGNEIAWLKKAKSRNWSKYLGLPGEANFNLNSLDTLATDTYIGLRNGLKIYRNNKVVWEGFIDGIDETAVDVVVHATSWLGLLGSRLVRPTAAEITAGTGHKYTNKRIADQIIKDFIDETNALNDTGISTSTGDGAEYPTNSTTGTFEFFYESTLSVMKSLGDYYGLDNDVVWNSAGTKLVWKCTKEANATNNEAIFFRYIGKSSSSDLYGKPGNNIKDIQRSKTLIGMANVIIAFPSGQGYEIIKAPPVHTDSSSIAQYGFWEKAIPFPYANSKAELRNMAKEFLAKHKRPIEIVNFKLRPNAPEFGEWKLGDYVRMTIEKGRFDIENEWRRVVGVECEIDDKTSFEDIEVITNPRLTESS